MDVEKKIESLKIHQGHPNSEFCSAKWHKDNFEMRSEFPSDGVGEEKSIVEHMLAGYALLAVLPNESDRSIDYRISAVNPAFENMISQPASVLLNKSIISLFPTKTNIWLENLDDVRVKGTSKIFVITDTKSGTYFEVLAYRKSVFEIVTLITDISEREKLKIEVQKTHKLRSIGLLAGGIAHDFNNILTGILGNISLMKLYLNSDPKISKIISGAEFSAKRAKSLTHQLLTFSELEEIAESSLSTSELLKDTVSFVLSGSGVRSRLEIPEQLWTCEIDEGQFYQIINNLIVNATEAIENDGYLGVSATNFNATNSGHPVLKDGFFVKISISDQGKGISPGEFEKIFEPYFSTKLNGLGLGLAIVKSIVDNNGGFISLKSRLGMGSTFSVYLPAIPKKAKSDFEIRPPCQAISGKGRDFVLDG